MIRLQHQLFIVIFYAAKCFVALPEVLGGGNAQGELCFDIFAVCGHFIMGGKGVAIGTEGAGHFEYFGVTQACCMPWLTE